MIKLHYFDDDHAAEDDIQLKMAINQGYVPPECLLGGLTVMALVLKGVLPCLRCQGPREKCKGVTKKY